MPYITHYTRLIVWLGLRPGVVEFLLGDHHRLATGQHVRIIHRNIYRYTSYRVNPSFVSVGYWPTRMHNMYTHIHIHHVHHM